MMELSEIIEKEKYYNWDYCYAELTDKIIFENKEDFDISSIEKDKVLEVRLFSKESELKIWRSDISKEFISRKSDDRLDHIDEWQYLDIDTEKSKDSFKTDGTVCSTGGGKYHLPCDSCEKVKIEKVKIHIRYYLNKYESGQARVCDWRIVEIGEEENNIAK